jgi:hypothetical protein
MEAQLEVYHCHPTPNHPFIIRHRHMLPRLEHQEIVRPIPFHQSLDEHQVAGQAVEDPTVTLQVDCSTICDFLEKPIPSRCDCRSRMDMIEYG